MVVPSGLSLALIGNVSAREGRGEDVQLSRGAFDKETRRKRWRFRRTRSVMGLGNATLVLTVPWRAIGFRSVLAIRICAGDPTPDRSDPQEPFAFAHQPANRHAQRRAAGFVQARLPSGISYHSHERVLAKHRRASRVGPVNSLPAGIVHEGARSGEPTQVHEPANRREVH